MSWLTPLLTLLALPAAAEVPSGILVNPLAEREAVPPGILVGEVVAAESTHRLTTDLADRGAVLVDNLEGPLAVTLGFPFLTEDEVTGFVIPGETCGTRVDIELHPPDPGEPYEIPESCWTDEGMTIRAYVGRAGHWDLNVKITDTETGAWTNPTTIRGFNPQPEPPAPALVGLDLDFSTPGLIVDVEVSDQNGTVYGF